MTLLCFACASDENTTINGEAIKFYEFPSDTNLQRHWESICTIFPRDKEVPIKRYLCELHFDQNSFILYPDKKIKPDAIPKNNQTNLLTGSVEPNCNPSITTSTALRVDNGDSSSCSNFNKRNFNKKKAKPYRLTIQINKVYLEAWKKSKQTNQTKTNSNSLNSAEKSNLSNNQYSNEANNLTNNTHNSHQCLICHKSFSLVTELYEHVKQHLVCDLCNTEFISQQSYQDHCILHKSRIKKFPYKCHICQILFESKDAIRKHSHTTLQGYNGEANKGTKVHYCKSCNMTFRNEPTYKKHLNSHMQKATLLTLNEAIKTSNIASPIGHLRPVIFTCRVCSEEFSSIADIDKHTKIHMDELQFPYPK